MTYRRSGVLRLAAGLGLLVVGISVRARATSNNVDHGLGIYNLENWGSQLDSNTHTSVPWKESVPTSDVRSAYVNFWTQMTSCTADACANGSSRRLHESEVTVDAMLSSTTGFLTEDMVFFYGHNVSIRDWDDDGDPFGAWVPFNTSTSQAQYYYTGSWAQLTLCTSCTYTMFDWGTSVIPYYYHQRGTAPGFMGIQDASWVAPGYAVFYGWNPLTSVLMGQDFRTGTWYSENTFNQATATARSGQLGGELEYFIGNGCQAVPVAQYASHFKGSAVQISDQARQIWKPSWRGLHLAMGHYYLTTTADIPNLTNFANDIKAGVPLITAYFNAHTCNYPSDIAMCQPGALAPRGTAGNELWTTQNADPTTTDEAGQWIAWWRTGG